MPKANNNAEKLDEKRKATMNVIIKNQHFVQ